MEFFQNKYIYVPILIWFLIQTFKVFYDLIKEKKLNFRRLVGAGGMPSSHSAIVMAITTLVGKYEGVDSSLFGVSLIFSLIVMYDAAGVRRAAGKQARILNKIIETPGLTTIQVNEKLAEALGHTPVQVFVGAAVGFIVGAIF
jgi:hypothetical protein